MTIPRLQEIGEYQQAHPPLHVVVASYLGAGKGSPASRASRADSVAKPNDMNGFFADVQAMGVDLSPLLES